jgi:hypothetical protein
MLNCLAARKNCSGRDGKKKKNQIINSMRCGSLLIYLPLFRCCCCCFSVFLCETSHFIFDAAPAHLPLYHIYFLIFPVFVRSSSSNELSRSCRTIVKIFDVSIRSKVASLLQSISTRVYKEKISCVSTY